VRASNCNNLVIMLLNKPLFIFNSKHLTNFVLQLTNHMQSLIRVLLIPQFMRKLFNLIDIIISIIQLSIIKYPFSVNYKFIFKLLQVLGQYCFDVARVESVFNWIHFYWICPIIPGTLDFNIMNFPLFLIADS